MSENSENIKNNLITLNKQIDNKYSNTERIKLINIISRLERITNT